MKSRPKTGAILGAGLASLGFLCSLGYIYFYITQSVIAFPHHWPGDLLAGIWGVIIGSVIFWLTDSNSTKAKFLKILFVGGIVILVVMDRLIGPMGTVTFVLTGSTVYLLDRVRSVSE